MADPAASPSSEVHAVLAESTQQELADAALRRDGYAVGDILDVRDTVAKWMEGRVVQIDPKKGYYINYLGWSEKWNEWIPKNSNRFAPHRSYTTKSTAPPQNAGAHQLEGENQVKFRATAAKFVPISAKAQKRASETKEGSIVSPDIDFTEAEWTFIYTDLIPQVNNILNSVINDMALVPEAAKFLQDYLHFSTFLLRVDHHDVRSTVFDSLMKVLNCDPLQSTDKRFYQKYGATGNEKDEIQNKGKYAVRPKATGSGDTLKVTSAYLIGFINMFGEWGGFDLIGARIAAEGDAAPTFLQYGYFSTILLNGQQYYESKMTKKFIPSLKWDIKSLLQRISVITDEELKSLTKEMLRAMMNAVIEIIMQNKELSSVKIQEAADRIQLAVVYRLLNSKILEKRLNGVVDLGDIVRVLKLTHGLKNGSGLSQKAQAEKDSLPKCYTTTKTFLEWCEQKNIVQSLLSLDSHEAVLQRSTSILKFLAANNALSVEPIFTLFDSVLSTNSSSGSGSVGKHEGFVRIVFEIVADVSSELNDATLDQLLARLGSIPKSNYSEAYMRFLGRLCQSCGRTNVARAVPLLKILWSLVTSTDPVVTNEVSSLAIEIFGELFASPLFDAQRISHVEMAMKALQVPNAPVLQLLRFLTNTLGTFPPHAADTQWCQNKLIDALNTKLNLIGIFFEEITRYHEIAKAVFAALPAEEKVNADPITSGGCTHGVNIQSRLRFLAFCLERCKTLPINTGHIDTLWRVLYTDAIIPSDSDRLFRWLTQLINDGSEAGSSTRHRPFTPFTSEVMKHIFTLLLERMDFATISFEAYRCLELYFCYVNCSLGHLAYAAKRHLSVLDIQGMIGLDRLWLLTATATEKKIFIASRTLLVSLYTKLDGKLARRRQDVTNIFIDRCLTDLGTYQQALQAGQEVQKNTQIALQYLLILEIFLANIDKINSPDPPASAPGGPQTMEDVKESTVDVRTSLDPNLNFHRITLSNVPRYFQLLFGLLDLGGEIAPRVWQLLAKLPTNQELEQRIVGIAATTSPVLPIDWELLFQSKWTVKLLYVLNIVHAFLSRAQESEDEVLQHAMNTWNQVFLVHGGFAFIYNYVIKMSLDNVFVDQSSALAQQCLASLLKLLNTFMSFPPGSRPAVHTDTIIDYPRFIPYLITVIDRAVKCQSGENEIVGGTEAAPSANSGLILNAFSLLSFCLTRVASTPSSVQIVTQYQGWDSILYAGLDHILGHVREQTYEGLKVLCSPSHLGEEAGSSSAPEGEPKPPSPIAQLSPMLTSIFLPKLLSILQRLDIRSVRCSYYFSLTRELLTHAPEYRVPIDAASIVSFLVQRIKLHPIIETRATDEDFVLSGFLSLLQEFLRQTPALKPSCTDLVREMYDNLFTSPITANAGDTSSSSSSLITSPSASSSSGPSPPKCKSLYSRTAAYRLLDELVYQSPANFHQLIQLLTPLHLKTHSNGSFPDEWEFESKSDEKSDVGYVGLRNLGATCYMNSTVQQFFMIPEFRHHLLAATPNKEEPPHLSVLYQLQSIMAFLQESEKGSHDPQGLCKSFVDFDGNPLNVGVQEDAAGFVTRLVDHLMESVKGTPSAPALKSAIYGSTLDQFIGHPPQCTHYREREEEFPTISLNVRNMKTIQDSLKAFVAGEDMIGSNAYKCAKCDKKVDTTKRTVFNNLPPTLIFNLKRFEMNYETMRSIKINDRMEFPTVLNMRPYTKDGIQQAERAAGKKVPAADGSSGSGSDGKEDESEAKPDSYYEYELTGVTVHTGSMDRGHYYSFIRERDSQGKWIEFNDLVVRPFDPRAIPDECFGGTETVQQFNAQGRAVEAVVEKQRNAYLLFYTRKQQAPATTATVAATSDDNTMRDVDSPVAVSSDASKSLMTARPKAPIPSHIFNSVWSQNLTYWRDRFVFDPNYFDFLCHILSRGVEWIPNAQRALAAGDAAALANLKCTNDDLTRLEADSAQLGTRFFLETLSRSRHKQQYTPGALSSLTTIYSRNLDACRWLMKFMSEHTAWSTDILLSCPIVDVRQQFARLIVDVETKLMDNEDRVTPPSVVASYIDSLINILRYAPEWWKRFNQFFLVIQKYAAKSVEATKYLLLQHNLLARLIDLYLGDQSPLVNNPFDMPLHPVTKKRSNVGDALIRPDMTAFLGLLTRLVCASQTSQPDTQPPTSVNVKPSDPLVPFSEAAQVLFESKVFLSRLLSDATSRKRGAYISTLLEHHCFENIKYSKTVIGALVTGIKNDQVDTLRPYFRVISGLWQISDSQQAIRQDILMQSLMAVLESSQQGFYKPMDFCLEHLIRLAKQHPSMCAWFGRNQPKTDWIISWLRAHPAPPRQGEQTLMHKPGRIDPSTLMQQFHPHDFAAFAPRSWPSMHHSTQAKLAFFDRLRQSQAIDVSNASDSDEELSERTFQLGQYVDTIDTTNKWLVSRIVGISPDGRSVKVHYDNWSTKYDEILPTDSIRITRFGRFSSRIIHEQDASSTSEGAVDDTAMGVSKLNVTSQQ